MPIVITLLFLFFTRNNFIFIFLVIAYKIINAAIILDMSIVHAHILLK